MAVDNVHNFHRNELSTQINKLSKPSINRFREINNQYKIIYNTILQKNYYEENGRKIEQNKHLSKTLFNISTSKNYHQSAPRKRFII